MAFGESELSTSLGTIADPFNVVNYPPQSYAWTAFNYGDLTTKYVYDSILTCCMLFRIRRLTYSFRNCTNITASYFWDYNFTPPRKVSSITRSLAFSEQINIEPYFYTYNDCSPTLSVPTELFSINKGWETCLDGISAFFDPPRILTPAAGLTDGDPPATTANADADSRGKPTTGAAATPQTPAPTATGRPPSNQETTAKVAPTSAIALDPAEPSHDEQPEVPKPSQQPPESHIDPAQSSATIKPPVPLISYSSIPDPFVAPISSKQASAPPADPNPSNPGISADKNPAPYGSPAPVDPRPTSAPSAVGGSDPGTPTNEPFHPKSQDSPLPAESNGDPPSLSAAPAVYVSDQRVTEGAPPITLAGKPIAYSAGSLHVGNTAIAVPVHSDRTGIAGGLTFSVADSSDIPAPPSPYPSVLPIGDSTVTAESASYFVIGGQTLKPGAAITVSGTPVSFAPSGSDVVIAGSTVALYPPKPTVLPVLTVDDHKITANSASQFMIGSQTLSPGGPAITVSGTRFSLAPFVSALIIGSSTSVLPVPAKSPAVITVGPSAYTAETIPQFLVASQTLRVGGPPIIISGTPVSLGVSASALVVNTNPLILHPSVISAAALTFGSSVYTADAASNFVIDGQTLKPGSAIVVSGTPISLGSHATDVVVGTVKEPVHLGALIMSGFGDYPPAPTLALETVNGISFSIDASRAIISGTTYSFGNDAVATTTLVLGGASLILGPSGYISGLPTLTPITVNGLTFSADATEAVISGTTYPIGSGAASTTITVGGTQVVRLGPGDVALPSITTIAPFNSSATGGGLKGFTGAAASSCQIGVLWGGFLAGLVLAVLVWL